MLGGNGCVPIYNLMKHGPAREISRAQIWQWIHHPNGVFSGGRKVTPELTHGLFERQMANLQTVGAERFAAGKYALAPSFLEDIARKAEFTEFMTLR